MLGKGDLLPPFSLMDDQGRWITNGDLDGTVILYFYPKDNTPGCTKQACAFRDGQDAFAERGARVIGVSADPIDSHQSFKTKFMLNFPLLADVDHTLCEAMGVWGEQSFRGQSFVGIARTTFVIRDGLILEVFADVDVMGHAERVLSVL